MNDGFRRLLTLVLVFALAFLAVFAFRQCQGGGSLLRRWQKKPSAGEPVQHTEETATLADRPALDLDDIEVLARENDEKTRLIRAVTPSVVSIFTPSLKKERVRDIFGRERLRYRQGQGVGSGVIISREGHVVTNHHVVAGKSRFTVTLHDGKSHPAKLIGSDPALDIAVLRISAEGPFQPLKFGDSDRVEVGQMVFAVGNAFGLGESVTFGHVSAKERSISDTQRDLFQTDAAINPGNSGGPLVNLRGEVIGINVAIYSPDRQNPGFDGVGFSIPANDARESFEAIRKRGRPVRGYLGVVILDNTPQVRQILNYNAPGGAAVDFVSEDSPAAKAGLQPCDVIQSYNGEAVRSRAHLLTLIQRSKVGKEATLGVWRAGKTQQLKATISEYDPDALAQKNTPHSASDRDILNRLGIHMREPNVLERSRGIRGVVVLGVASGRVAEQYGLRPGDLILGINGVAIQGPADFVPRLVASAAAQDTVLLVYRQGRRLLIRFPSVSKPPSS